MEQQKLAVARYNIRFWCMNSIPELEQPTWHVFTYTTTF